VTDRDWEAFARAEPFFAVLTDERFLRERMSDADRAAFFASGEADVDRILGLLPGFAPQSALDFGCGVGRLTRALALRVPRVAGVDVAPSMLALARQHAPEASFSTELPDARFDFILSLIVFQHIAVRRGEQLLHALLERLAPGGAAAIQLTFRRAGSPLRRLARRVRARVPLVHTLAQRLRGERAMPYMEMNEYDLDRVTAIFRAHGCTIEQMLPTDHGGIEGAIVIARSQGTR
jgi:trans-aconitate methyltransferase